MQSIASERQRKLQQVSFQESQVLTRDLPRDTILKALFIRLSGSVVTTFASGTPVADAQSTMDNLIPRIDIVINGNRTVKSVRPHLLHMQQLMATQIQGERKSSAAASAATGNNPTADGGFTYGSTTNYTTVAETVYLPFENIMCQEGQETTWLNLKGVSSAEIRFTTAAFASLLGFGNTAPVVFSSSTFVIDITTSEAQNVPPEVYFSDWRQTTKEVTYSAQVTESVVDINRGNLLQGVMFFTRNGAAGSATTATGKVASNLVLNAIKLVLNGNSIIKSTSFLELQSENRNRWGLQAAYSSNVSRFDGIAYLDLLVKGRLSSALDVRPQKADQIQLLLDSRSSNDVSYTNPVSVTLMTNEIVTPRE